MFIYLVKKVTLWRKLFSLLLVYIFIWKLIQLSEGEESNRVFKITLRENGIHSLEKGIEIYSKYLENNDDFALKESIMFLHHGIELLMKEILINKNEFLIFEDLKSATKKQLIANQEKTGIFMIRGANPPKTVSYEEAIKRVRAFLDPDELNETLVDNLLKLNSFRNKVEHHEVNIDKQEIITLIEKILIPIKSFFENKLALTKILDETVQVVLSLTDEIQLEFQKSYNEIRDLMLKFDGRRLPGKYFSFFSKVTLPKFDKVVFEAKSSEYFPEIELQAEYTFDILGISGDETWIIEIQHSSRIRDSELISLRWKYNIFNSVIWLVTPNSKIFEKRVPSIRKTNFYISDQTDLDRINLILDSNIK